MLENTVGGFQLLALTKTSCSVEYRGEDPNDASASQSFPVIVENDQKHVLQQGKQKSAAPRQKPMPGIQQQFPDILRQSFESPKQQGEQLKQFLEIVAKRDETKAGILNWSSLGQR